MPRYRFLFFAQSVDADRMIRGVGKFPKGVWVEVNKAVYDTVKSFTRVEGSGWKVKRVRKKI